MLDTPQTKDLKVKHRAQVKLSEAPTITNCVHTNYTPHARESQIIAQNYEKSIKQ